MTWMRVQQSDFCTVSCAGTDK